MWGYLETKTYYADELCALAMTNIVTYKVWIVQDSFGWGWSFCDGFGMFFDDTNRIDDNV